MIYIFLAVTVSILIPLSVVFVMVLRKLVEDGEVEVVGGKGVMSRIFTWIVK